MIIFAYPGYEALAQTIASKLGVATGEVLFRNFPDGESYVQILTEVRQESLVLVGSLDYPNDKALSMMFFAQTAREFGAKDITLVAPYLGYMRQDIRFHEGEAITSRHFAAYISTYFDRLITIDPHLHRYHALNEIYTIPTETLHAGSIIAQWIKTHVTLPLLIGPDSESEQWVADVAGTISAPYLVLDKERSGDYQVAVSMPKIEAYRDTHTPVLVDDIISTAHTMMETVEHLSALNAKPALCIGVHAIFAESAYDNLSASHVEKVVTSNTVTHPSNQIDISDLFVGVI